MMDDASFFSGLRPELADLARAHREQCQAAHLHTAFEADAGWRSPEAQTRLFQQGRKWSPRGWMVVDPKKVRTNALPKDAPHCRGAAYDIWLLFGKPGEAHLRNATMDPADGWTPAEIEQQTTLWGALVRIGAELGLEAGAHWPKLKDWPHFQLSNWRDLPLKDAT